MGIVARLLDARVAEQFREGEGVSADCAHSSCSAVPSVVKAEICQIAFSGRLPERSRDVLRADAEDVIGPTVSCF